MACRIRRLSTICILGRNELVSLYARVERANSAESSKSFREIGNTGKLA